MSKPQGGFKLVQTRTDWGSFYGSQIRERHLAGKAYKEIMRMGRARPRPQQPADDRPLPAIASDRAIGELLRAGTGALRSFEGQD